MANFNVIENPNGVPVKAWNNGVQFEESAKAQLLNVASLPFVWPYVASMPDAHWGNGATVGSVIPADGAIIPSAVGVDIGCGMIAVLTDYFVGNKSLPELRKEIERVIPAGRTNNGGEGDRGAWHNVPADIHKIWAEEFVDRGDFEYLFNGAPSRSHPEALSKNAERQLGTLGTGNHFVELCYDQNGAVWIVLHSGSRGFGNKIGSYFAKLAKELCAKWFVKLPDPELAYFPKFTSEYDDYVAALRVAQRFAWRNREIMVRRILEVLDADGRDTVHCHHNYMAEEQHFGKKLIITRKGAVDASLDKRVIIPGSMGARTYIARGLGSRDSFHSCAHGAGRAMGRNQARKTITVGQHIAATEGVECYKGEEVIDESPAAYKDIESVMAAQTDLVEPLYRLKQFLCVKGIEDSRRRR